MIPIGDADVRRRSFPIVNVTLIGISVVVFLYQWQLSDLQQQVFVLKHGLIPAELTNDGDFTRLRTIAGTVDITSPFGTYATLFTSMFLHGGFMHVLGNMLYLWVFGNNIEDRLGHAKYLVFYLAGGLAAALAQVAIDSDSQVPMVGASGAIAGVLGAYLLAYPYSRINALVVFFFITFVRLPALYLLGFWFIYQWLMVGWGSLGPQVSGGGVAYFAHIGGFVAGIVMMGAYKLVTREPLIPRRPWYLRY